MRSRLKRWFKLRFFITYPFGLFLLFFCSPTAESFSAGIGFIIFGLLIRLWANGYAIKTEKLTISGPYSIMRHPLYLGTLFIALGFVIMLRTAYVGAVFMIVLITVYYRTIKNEETALSHKYKEKYKDYKNWVPAIIPTFFPYKNGAKWSFSFRRIIKNKEYKLFIWVINIVIFFLLKARILEHKSMDSESWGLVSAFLALGTLDIAGEISKKKKKS